MTNPQSRFWSSLGKKLLTGATGVGLLLFVLAHLAGNLALIAGRDAFNAYAHALTELGPLLVVAELGLIALFGLHAVAAVGVTLDNRRARSVPNTLTQSKGPPSKQSLSSRTMIVTGAVLLLFTVVHVIQFRFGPGESQGYVAALGDQQVRDLYRLVVESFQSVFVTVFYLAVMVFLGFHLRHGFWSAFQSIGLLGPRLRPLAYAAGVVFAVAVALGFFILPLYLHFGSPDLAASGVAMGVRP